jgi:hypothetical protein
MATALIYATNRFLLVQPCAGFRGVGHNMDEPSALLPPDAGAADIGAAVLQTLSRYKKLTAVEVNMFFDLAHVEDDYQIWVSNLLKLHAYSSKKELFKSMKHCSVRLQDDILKISPTKHEKLEAWSGTGQGGQDNVELEAPFSSGDVGQGVLTALERCL